MKRIDYDKHFVFDIYFPREVICLEEFKKLQVKISNVCSRCGNMEHIWYSASMNFEWKLCHCCNALRSVTIMNVFKLFFLCFFKAIHLFTNTRISFSTSEKQRRLGCKGNCPIWEILHKIRSVTGQCHVRYTLLWMIEQNEGFFSTERDEEEKNKPLRCERDKSKQVEIPSKLIRVNRLKTLVNPNLKVETINQRAAISFVEDSKITTVRSSLYTNFKNHFAKCNASVLTQDDLLVHRRVYTVLRSAKILLFEMFQSIKSEFLERYLNEFCCPLNRNKIPFDPFGRLLPFTSSCKSSSKQISYRKVNIQEFKLCGLP